ncbi:MAG: homoserine O-succinyltransferase [Planctomycetota bacterium]
MSFRGHPSSPGSEACAAPAQGRIVLSEPRGCAVTWQCHGPIDAPMVVVQGGISANAQVADSPCGSRSGWWRNLVGPGCAIDTTQVCVLSLDYLGGPQDRFGYEPASVTPRLQAAATARVLRALGVSKLRAFVGASYGGMVGLALAARYPQLLEKLLVISAPATPDPTATAWRCVQRRILELGEAGLRRDDALALARALAMTTYRSRDEFRARFSTRTTEANSSFPVEEYLTARGRAFVARFSTVAYARLSLAMDLHDVDPRQIRVPTTVVGTTTDQLVPPQQLRELARSISAPTQLELFYSPYGHDAFLKETDRLAAILRCVGVEGGSKNGPQ